MRPIVIFLVVILALTAESAIRGKSHKTQLKAVKDEEAPEPVSDDGDDEVEWPQPPKIKNFNTEGDYSAHGGYEAGDHTKTKQHGKSSRRSHP